MLTSDWNNRQAPDVTRLVFVVDAPQCIDPAKVRDRLATAEKAEWTALGTNQGWLANIQGRYVGLSQSTVRCLASLFIGTRLGPLPMPTTQRMRIGPSGRPERVPLPVH